MALADYYLCDECGAKTFYDARLPYDDVNANPDTGHPWPDNVGWMRVLCLDCAEAARSESEDTQAKATPAEADRVKRAMSIMMDYAEAYDGISGDDLEDGGPDPAEYIARIVDALESGQPKPTPTQADVDALVDLRALMLLPDPEGEHSIGAEGTFDPWALFPNVYGSYDADFDVCAVEVLTDILEGERRRDDLAGDIFREMLCSMGLCEYGTSPRACFPEPEFRQALPTLIQRWKYYYLTQWGAALTPFQKG